MDMATRITDIKQNPAALLALSWYYKVDPIVQTNNALV